MSACHPGRPWPLPRLTFILFLLVPCGPARAEPPAPPIAVEIEPAELMRSAEPPYPPQALQARVEGAVQLELQIDAAGAVISVRVVRGAGFGFDEAAAEAAASSFFGPRARAARASRRPCLTTTCSVCPQSRRRP